MSMTNSRPYIIRGLYDWIVENECTPYLLVDALWPGVSVPEGFAEDEQVVLNVSPMAVRELQLENEAVSFMARFGGRSCDVYVPVDAVMAIYARENGQGMVFEMDPRPDGEELDLEDDTPTITMVDAITPDMVDEVESGRFEVVDSSSETDDTQPPRPTKGRPSLKVVK